MPTSANTSVKQRLRRLETHLELENPILLKIVKSFRILDGIAHRIGVLPRDESYAVRVPFWPIVSILGTYSSGKSTFVNHYIGDDLQLTGNQAVDDKFTVICYASEPSPRVLPGLALDADPRFPFYQISRDIEQVAAGEGRRVDAYLQLKTCRSESLLGKILIDSPGFDADAQRTSTLRITDHIIDLSDLVLVFFDARHPEPGAMQDALEHLVGNTVTRPDSNKFLYILNQIDATAMEDNPEEVFAAWQRALAQKGLTAGRFFRIYNPDVAIPIENPKLRERFESKRDADMAEIHGRMRQVEIERAYRIIGWLEKTAKTIEADVMPRVAKAKEAWKHRVLWLDGIVFGLVFGLLLAASIWAGYWEEGMRFVAPSWLQWVLEDVWRIGASAGAVLVVAAYLHFGLRKIAAQAIIDKLRVDPEIGESRDALISAFSKNTRPIHSMLNTKPVGWGRYAQKKLAGVLEEADGYVQELNDRFTNPSGGQEAATETQNAAASAPVQTPPSPHETPTDEQSSGSSTQERVQRASHGDLTLTADGGRSNAQEPK